MKPTQHPLPEILSGIPGLPRRLWLNGTFPTMLGVGMVGTRRPTSYGRKVASLLGAAVASTGWPVISGLARGIDGIVHRACVEQGHAGWAVLGSGLDVVYPRQNQDLAESLLERGGGLISEYPPGTPPAPFRFPARNRIIAALSSTVVVIEATVVGGALITARIALELGRDVLAVPGDIDRPTSEGCNLLIRDGAYPVLSPEDLIETLTFLMGPPPEAVVGPKVTIDVNEALAASDQPVGRALADLTRQQLGL